MKKILKSLAIILCFTFMIIPMLTLSACDFTVDYKSTSDKLNSAIQKFNDSDEFGEGNIELSLFDDSSRNISISYNTKYLPKLTFGEDFKESFEEVDTIYNSIFAFSMNYVSGNAQMLSTKPKVKTLTERQENLYEKLDKTIEKFNSGVSSFKKEIKTINQYYSNKVAYGKSSEEVYLLNFKKAYRNFIYLTLDLSNAIDDVAAEIYTEFDYIEYVNKEGSAFKSLENGINIKVFEGYFTFLVDSFDCRIPTLAIDANDTMKEIVNLYAAVKTDYKNLFKKYVAHTSETAHSKIEQCLSDSSLDLTEAEKTYLNSLKNAYGQITNMSKEQIAKAREIANVYFEEMEIYNKAYKNLGFERFYFQDDCNLTSYIARDSANENRYEKIKDYLKNILPKFNEFIDATFLTF